MTYRHSRIQTGTLLGCFLTCITAGCSTPPPGQASGRWSNIPPDELAGSPVDLPHLSLGAAAVTEPGLYIQEPWKFSVYHGTRITTPNYRLHTTIDYQKVLERLPIFMEAALVRYTTALGDLPSPPRRLQSYIFRDHRQWLAKTRQMLPSQVGSLQHLGRGGYTTQGTIVIYYIDWAGRDKDTFAIAAHEGWHQYAQATLTDALPTWLDEGIATWMEGHRFHGNETAPSFNPADNWERKKVLQTAIRADSLIPLDELLTKRPQYFLGQNKSQLLVYYAQTWALTNFLVDGEGGLYRRSLTQLLQDSASGTLYHRLSRSPSLLAAGRRRTITKDEIGTLVVRAYFNTSMAEFERQYLRHARAMARE